jgi:hypothetical protein
MRPLQEENRETNSQLERRMGEADRTGLSVNLAWSPRFMTLRHSSRPSLSHSRCHSLQHRLGRRLVPIAILLFLALPAAARGTTAIDLDLYARLLESHTRAVSDTAGTRVDYRGLEKSQDWKRLVRQIHAAEPSRLARDEKLAFWINAYNILAIDLVAKHYPLDGIKEIGSFFSPVWDLEVATIEGRPLSLGAIEHEILRKMDEPRIHGAIVCASVSCPPLARTPFRPSSLDADLSAAMRNWLASREKGIAIDRSSRVVRLSKVFDWFEGDFESRGGVLAAIAPFLDSDDATWIRAEGRNTSIRYLDYDWSLNDLR